jgi:hypothetical protein
MPDIDGQMIESLSSELVLITLAAAMAIFWIRSTTFAALRLRISSLLRATIFRSVSR